MTSPEVHAIILTMDEQMHLRRCIESILPFCTSILVVDSGSRDDTVQIAREMGAEVISRPWVNYSTQFNHGIAHRSGREGWLLRIDADEYFTEQGRALVADVLRRAPAEVDGVLVNRRIKFFGRIIRWGSVDPNWQLRLWRVGRGVCEQRWMDEHILVDGGVVQSKIDLVDENLNSMDWWTNKHNKYASREVIDFFASRGELPANQAMASKGASAQAKRKRQIKDKVYNRLPISLRSTLYFSYRYLFRLGFLDGRAGFFFHFFQGWWYRCLVDAKIAEVRDHMAATGASAAEAIFFKTGFDVRASLPPQAGGDPAALSQ